MTGVVKVEGLADLEKALDDLTFSAGKGVLRRSLKKAAEPLVEIARGMVPVDDGDLKNSISVSAKLAPSQAGQHRKMFRNDRLAIEMFLGPSYNLGRGGRHGHLVEFGTAPHLNKGKFAGSQHPGTAPQPFMRPAWDQDQKALLDRLSKNLWAELEKSLERAKRKAARQASKL